MQIPKVEQDDQTTLQSMLNIDSSFHMLPFSSELIATDLKPAVISGDQSQLNNGTQTPAALHMVNFFSVATASHACTSDCSKYAADLLGMYSVGTSYDVPNFRGAIVSIPANRGQYFVPPRRVITHQC